MYESETVLKALDESKQHWETLLEATKNLDSATIEQEGFTSNACALCHLFLIPYERNLSEGIGTSKDSTPCEECPIAIKSGRTGCIGTPWGHAANALEAIIYHYKYPIDSETHEKIINTVQRELDYIKEAKQDYINTLSLNAKG